MKQELYVFWKSGSPTKVSGGKVKEFLDDGTIRTDKYPDYAFKPLLVVPLEAGLALDRQINTLSEEYANKEAELKIEYLTKLGKLII